MRFPSNATGTAKFEEWLKTHRQGIHDILVDVPEEVFHRENIPPLGGHDRRAMITRKLAHQFPGRAYATHISLGRETTGRRDEHLLLTGLAHSSTVDLWLNPLMKQELAVSAIRTPALLLPLLLDAIRPAASRGLLIAFSEEGQRHVYFDKRTICFARLLPVTGTKGFTDAQACHQELRKTLQYLGTQRWIERNERMPAYLLLDTADAAEMLAVLSAEAQLTLHHASLEALSPKFRLRSKAPGSDSKTLMIQLAMNAGKTAQLAPADLSLFFRADRMARYFLAYALLGFCIFLAASFDAYREIRALRRELVRHDTQRMRDEARLSELQNSLPELPATADTLLRIANLPLQHEARRNQPISALSLLSRSLDRFPEIELDTVTWHRPALNFDSRPSGLKLIVQARMKSPENAALEQGVARLQAFSADLEAQGVEIQELDTPFNAAPGSILQNLQKDPEEAEKFRLTLNFGVSGS